MAATETEPPAPKKKRSKLPLVLGVVLALALGGGGFYAVYSGMILGQGDQQLTGEETNPAPLPDIAFLPMEPLVVSLGATASARHLRFAGQLEVEKQHQAEVALLMPRVLDVLNGYLRALDVAELEDRTALFRLRSQMLRRIQIVTGEGRVRDLLVTEFVLN